MELIVIDYFLGSENLSDELSLHFFLCKLAKALGLF